MRGPWGAAIPVATGLLLSACAAGHALPVISEADSASAMQEIAAAPHLNTTARTATENEEIARRVISDLQGAAQPICAELDRNCWYTMEFSPKGEMNAYVLKNQIVLYNGLAQYLETDDEFAAVLGHEIGHHMASHYEKAKANRAIGAIIGGIIFAGVAAASGAYDNNPYLARTGTATAMSIGAQMGGISFSKEHEREADYMAAYLMTRAGYNPDAGGALWIKLAKTSGKTKTGLFDTHPAGPDRLAAWKLAVEEVRYSTDLMPNLAGAEAEPGLQLARSFNAPSGALDGSETGVALASLSIPDDPSFGGILGGTNKALNSVGSGVQDADYVPATGATWAGGGASDGCGVAWRIEATQSGRVIRGNMWWMGMTYDLYGEIDSRGRARDAFASKSVESPRTSGPSTFKLDFDLLRDSATGHYVIDNQSANCRTDFVLSRG